ncbi:hypothetical protein [Microbulbifer sp. ALW1]|uniref:hypothetical protein n=1 Tax=Microbulbifer sp. (strain ALW1) TaxID=1516059 RepID=UPI00135B85C8|nr:hypothetical protein [Microbulbifer sp. ALW1]
MLKRFFRREKSNIYLGTIAVVPRSDIKSKLDPWGSLSDEDMDLSLREYLAQIFDIPCANGVSNPEDTDLVLDVMVPKFQSGDLWDVSIGEVAFPIFWRPKIEIASRLYNLKTGKTVTTTRAKSKMPWREYFSRLFSWRSFLGFKPLFDSSDMNKLLLKACIEVLSKFKKVTRS